LPEIQKELDGRYADFNVEALAISTGDPEWYLSEFKNQLNVTMPWLMMDTRLPNPYYQEQYDLWGLNDNHPTLVVLDTNGVIRYRATGDGGVAENNINYRFAFDLVGELFEEAQTQAATANAGWDVGKRAHDFTLSTLEGESHTLSDYFGNTILLTFWGTGCLDCGDLVPGVYAQEIRQRYGDPDNLVVLGVDHHTPLDFMEEFLIQMSIDYPVLIDPQGTVFNRYKIFDEFVFIVIDPEGVIRYRELELEGDIFKVLDEFLLPPP
jgi:peroxiredoxin